MTASHASPLRLKVLGLEQRALNMFRLFLKGPCHNRAVIVDDGHAADACLIDIDAHHGTKLLSEQRKSHPDTTFIVLSMKRYAASEGLIFVQKPARTQDMLSAIDLAQALALARRQGDGGAGAAVKSGAGMKVIRAGDRSSQGTTHRVAMLMDEQSFGSYLGHRDDVDPKSPWEWRGLFIDPNQFLQTHIEGAVKLAEKASGPTRIETPWKLIYFLPEQRLVWIDAEEAQIRSACAIPFQNIASPEFVGPDGTFAGEITPLDDDEVDRILRSGNAQAIETFRWKVALWTSKGRLPTGFDPRQPVTLVRWPNFTRVLITPHAMRIAAMLWYKPASLFEVASALGIRQQFVFAFFYAANTLGNIGVLPASSPAKQPAEPSVPPAPEKAERASLLSKILKRLKAI